MLSSTMCAGHPSGTQYPLIKVEGIVPISYHGLIIGFIFVA